MPELPEVESVVRTLRSSSPSLIGHTIEKGFIYGKNVICGCSGEEFLKHVLNTHFTAVERYGKYIIFHLKATDALTTSPLFLVIHLRMTGRLFLVPAEEICARYTRLSLLLDGQLALRFDDPRTFGKAWLVEDPSVITSTLGPDALTVTPQEFEKRCGAAKRQLKPLLLDQSFIAGIGNIYADETLFRCGLHPLTNSRDLAPDEIFKLHKAVQSVLEEAVEANGANIDGVFKAGKFTINVYGRGGKACHVCSDTIVKITVGQRGTHFCPSCQPKR